MIYDQQAEPEVLTSRVVAEGLVFGEGPRWHDGHLWISDMLAGAVVRLEHDGSWGKICSVPGSPSGLGWLPDGRMLVVSMADASLLAVTCDKIEKYADLSICRGTPNDMIVDQKGRAYVGNAGCNLFAGIDPKPTNLVLVEDGQCRSVADDLIFPNGMAISPDGKRLIVAESFAHRLTIFDISADSGSLSERRVFAELGGRTPDGICLDDEGAVWVSSAETGEVLRIKEGGEITHSLDTRERFAAACVTGGADRRTLYFITTEMSPDLFKNRATSSRVESCYIPIPGAGWP